MAKKMNAAERAVFFLEHLKLSEGRWGGQDMHLMDWQRKATTDVFGTLKPDGTRQYREVYIRIPKKNGKSPWGSGVALYLTFADGEPAAKVFSAAADREQAGIVYNIAEAMVDWSPELSSRSFVYQGTKTIYVPSTKSTYKIVSSESRTKHGPNLSGLIFDEFHTQPDRRLYDVLTKGSGAARRQPLFVYLTTAGDNINSICYELDQYALRVLKFRNPEEYSWVTGDPIDDPTFYAVIFCLPPDSDWEDPANWYKVNPALGEPGEQGKILDINDFKRDFEKAKRNIAEENIFRQLRLDEWVKQSVRWMRMGDWDKCGAEAINEEELKNRPCYGGLDLSTSVDLTALALAFQVGERFNLLMKYWIPEATAEEAEKRDHVPYREWAHKGFITMTPGNRIDYRFIRQDLKAVVQDYDLKELAYDPWNASKLIQELQEDGFVIDEKESCKGHPLLVDFRQGYRSLSPAAKDFQYLVLGQEVVHGGNPVLRWNVDNLVVTKDPAGNIKPDKAKSTQRIDGAVASMMAIDRAIKHKEDDGPSVYETRGIITL
jgi:phage terminase large subunit-like protein